MINKIVDRELEVWVQISRSFANFGKQRFFSGNNISAKKSNGWSYYIYTNYISSGTRVHKILLLCIGMCL